MIARFFIILFRRKKTIEEIYLNYETKHLFDNSYLVINYRFRNAIYFRFANHKTLEKQIKIFNIKNFDNEFVLIVYGFFQKKVYKMQFDPQFSLNSNSFKTTIDNLSLKLGENKILELAYPNIHFEIDIAIDIPKITLRNSQIKVTTKSFNLNEYL